MSWRQQNSRTHRFVFHFNWGRISLFNSIQTRGRTKAATTSYLLLFWAVSARSPTMFPKIFLSALESGFPTSQIWKVDLAEFKQLSPGHTTKGWQSRELLNATLYRAITWSVEDKSLKKVLGAKGRGCSSKKWHKRHKHNIVFQKSVHIPCSD